jgi:hypothetical protein
MLNMVGGVGEQHLAVAQVPAGHAHLIVRAEGPGEQPVSVQALEPLTVEPIGLRSTGGALRLTGVDQQDLQASRFQELKEGNPVDASRFHSDSGHATVNEPVGQGVEVGGERAETAHGLGVATRWHGDPVLSFADVDARSVGVADLEGFGEHG